MPKVVGIKFKKTPKVYYFEACEGLAEGAAVIVETAQGLEFAEVAKAPFDIDESRVVQPLKPIVRIATEADIAQMEKTEQKRAETFAVAGEMIRASGLDMKLVDVRYTFDNTKLILSFTAENRVDFRELVRSLAATFKVRIELRQIGARDECKLKGGLGPCGRACCCSDHMPDFAHVSMKMAKTQNLSLNPGKISGLCGRLMCCLAYENEHYKETNKLLPKMGSEVKTTEGVVGTVIGINHISEKINLRVASKDIFVTETYPLSQIIMDKKPLIIEDEPADTEEPFSFAEEL